jgi:glycine/D-amino acid oxidase-like deaminating enzyme
MMRRVYSRDALLVKMQSDSALHEKCARMSKREPAAASLYAETARPAPPTSPLAGDAKAKVVIVGGGFTGLSAALHLAERGVDALVVEAEGIGWGASGRNGGQVNPGLKWEPERLLASFGPDLGGRMARLGATAPDLVFDLVARNAIDCEARRGGTIRAAVTKKSEAGIREHIRQGGADILALEGEGMAHATGTAAYAMGSLDRRGGNLNPLGYARGLAEAAIKAGARIATSTRALKLSCEAGRWRLTTDKGIIIAERVILGTNGYSDDLWPGLRKTVVPVLSSIAATEPLPAEVAATILPGRASLYEVSASHAYYRLDAFGRFLMGGRGVMRPSSEFADYRGLIAHAVRLFPTLAAARWRQCWNGRVAVTWDELPHIHEPAEGLGIGLGYNGRGVAMATAMGRMLARRAAGGTAEELDLPVTEIAPMFAHFGWPLAVAARLKWDTAKERFAG